MYRPTTCQTNTFFFLIPTAFASTEMFQLLAIDPASRPKREKGRFEGYFVTKKNFVELHIPFTNRLFSEEKD